MDMDYIKGLYIRINLIYAILLFRMWAINFLRLVYMKHYVAFQSCGCGQIYARRVHLAFLLMHAFQYTTHWIKKKNGRDTLPQWPPEEY